MARPDSKTQLNPRRPHAVLCWAMRQQRQLHGVSLKEMATLCGCHESHISRVETGKTKPSRELVDVYEQRFLTEGLLLSMWQVADGYTTPGSHSVGGHGPLLIRAIPGDASVFLDDTVPHGTVMQAGQTFTKTWWVRNAGTVPWVGRVMRRQGPTGGPGLIASPRHCEVPNTAAGEVAEISIELTAPTYYATSIAYFKMAHGKDQALCFPDMYQLGLDVLVRVANQAPDILPEADS